MPDHFNHIRCHVGGHHRLQRVPRREIHQGETDKAHPQCNGRGIGQAAQDQDEHRTYSTEMGVMS